MRRLTNAALSLLICSFLSGVINDAVVTERTLFAKLHLHQVHLLIVQHLIVFRYSFKYLVEMRGFEPLTPCLQGRCSPN